MVYSNLALFKISFIDNSSLFMLNKWNDLGFTFLVKLPLIYRRDEDMRLAYANEESKYFLAERKKKPYNFDVRKLFNFKQAGINDLQ